MASYVLQAAAVFPDGTSVGAYPAQGQSTSLPGPLGSATSTQTIAGGTCTFTGLDQGSSYVAIGSVSGTYRRIAFALDAPTDSLTIDASQLEDDSVDTDAIQDDAVVAAKIGDGAIFTHHLDPEVAEDLALGGDGGFFLRRSEWGPVPVDSLVDDPDSETDWGPILNSAYADDNVRHFVFNDRRVDPDGTDYPFTTPLDFVSSIGVVLEGPGAITQTAGSPPLVEGEAPARLVYNGTGAPSAIDGGNSGGFTMRDLGVYYTSAAFTGKLIDLGRGGVAGVCGSPLLQRCDLRSRGNLRQSAKAIVGWDGSILAVIDGCVVAGAQWCVLGAEEGEAEIANANLITGQSIFYNAAIALLGNIQQNWTIENSTFEMWATAKDGGGTWVETPAVIASDWTTTLHSYFTFRGNWVGDFGPAVTDPSFVQSTTDYWHATFTNNTIFSLGGLTFDLQGGGLINIVNNPRIASHDSGPLIDLGDTGAGAIAKRAVTITGNEWTNPDEETIINREGHYLVNIYGNDFAGGARELRTIGGQERVGYLTNESAPTIVVGAARGAGGAAVIHGTDTAGIIILAAGAGPAAGLAATITLDEALVPSPGGEPSWQGPIVMLTPLKTAAGHSGANGVAAGAYVEIDEGTTFGSWKLHVADAPASSLAYAYRMIGL